MSQPLLSPTALRRASLDAVLGFAWDADAFTASDVLERVGLTRSTTIDVIDELVARGLLAELPNARAAGDYRKGRPARRFAFQPDAAFVVGVDAGASRLTATVADLRGERRAVRHLSLEPAGEAPEVRRRAATELVDEALADAGIGRADVAALCVGVPAPVDRHGASPPHRDDFWRRMNPDFASVFAEWAPIVRVENDASLAAVAERAVGAAVGCDDFVALLAGDRLGAGVWVDGRLLRGAHGGAAETVAFDHVRGVDGAWGLGYRAAELARRAVAEGTLPEASALAGLGDGQIDGKTVLALAAAGDDGAREIAAQVGETLAIVAGVLGSLFDSRLIVVSGAVAAGADPVIAAARDALPRELDLPAPEIVASTLGAEIVSVGAVRAALEAARAGALDLAMFAE
ncbi:ROK family protein [Microbacterium sp. M3]|uniref:ROK family protein n=1 Tax=Microbacterium arthrosphaerae TaxID=792652 RepID=A0ABU4H5A8_9MICO|nr:MULTISPECIES: ROK family protein [Microbacterium]MDW4574511.1 ROK family protein [Microbacterium arthrosphaerae]MDW7608366.1 ROK family protein [Microbacterium sp. M3]